MVEWIALVAHHIQHRTVSTHVQRLYPLSVTGFLQSKHLHTSFDKFVWVPHSTWVKPFTGPASLENMECQDKIIFQSRLRPTRLPWLHFLFRLLSSPALPWRELPNAAISKPSKRSFRLVSSLHLSSFDIKLVLVRVCMRRFVNK